MNSDTTFDWLGVNKRAGNGRLAPEVLFSPASLVDSVARPTPPPLPHRHYLLENVPADNFDPYLHNANGHNPQATLHPVRANLYAHSVELFPLSDDDDSVPLSLTAQELTLAESKTYMRWYSDILLRTNAPTICLADIFSFLNNFKLTQAAKDQICRIFHRIMNSINIGEFFAVLRVIAHALIGDEIKRQMIKIAAPPPVPPLILSKKRQNDDNDLDAASTVSQELKPLDIDLFSQFILTGERPEEKKGRKKQKSVKFSDQVVTHDELPLMLPTPQPQAQPVDYQQMLMDQLLRMRLQQQQPQAMGEQEQMMDSQANSYQNMNNVDNSQQQLPENLLQPNMTGPAQMAQYLHEEQKLLQPNMTGPAQMAKLFEGPTQPSQRITESDMSRIFGANEPDISAPRISLQSFTSQMTGTTQENTMHNADMASPYNQQHLSFFNPTSHHDSTNTPIPWPETNRNQNQPQMASQTQAQNQFQSQFMPPQPPASRQRSMLLPQQTEGVYGASLGVPQRPQQSRTPPPPPPRRRNVSYSEQPPALPPKIELSYAPPPAGWNAGPPAPQRTDSTSNILDDLKALEEEVNKIRDMTGGF